MDAYNALKIYRLVPLSEVPKDSRVMGSLWVHGTKPDPKKPGSLMPTGRWCVKSTQMEHEIYESFFDCMMSVTLNIMYCLYAAYSKYLNPFTPERSW